MKTNGNPVARISMSELVRLVQVLMGAGLDFEGAWERVGRTYDPEDSCRRAVQLRLEGETA